MNKAGAWAVLLAVFGGLLWVLSANDLGARIAHGLILTAILGILLADAGNIVNGLNSIVDRATGQKGN